MSTDKSTKRQIVLAGLAFIVFWTILQTLCPYHLAFKEQADYFLLDRTFVLSFLKKPAFLSELAGGWLTQFYMLVGFAPVVQALLCVLVWAGMSVFLKREGAPSPYLVALVPAMLDGALSCVFEYPVSMTIGAVLAVWTAVACQSCKGRLQKPVELLTLLLGYPLIGASVFVLLVLFIYKNRRSLGYVLSIAVSLTAEIFLLRNIYMLTSAQAFVYPVVPGYYFGFTALIFAVEAGTLLAAIAGMSSDKRLRCFLMVICGVMVVVAFCLTIKPKEEWDIKISSLAYYGKWDKVNELGKTNPYKSVTGSYFYNISSSRNGTLPEDILEAYQPLWKGLFLSINENSGYRRVFDSVDALMVCGDFAQAQHSALLGMTFTPRQRSSRMLHRLCEIAMVNGDFAAAKKYADMLHKTSLHSGWASSVLSMIESGERLPVQESVKDILFSANDWFASLRDLAEENDAALDRLLCLDLLIKDIASFRKDYDTYYKPRHTSAPALYQQALMMTFDGNISPSEQLSEYAISSDVSEMCLDFISRREAGETLAPDSRFGKTYWYYYYFAQPK